MPNRFYPQTQAAISALGDHIANEQRLIRALVDIRNLNEEAAEQHAEHIIYMLKNTAKIASVPESSILDATHQDMEAGGAAGSSDSEPD